MMSTLKIAGGDHIFVSKEMLNKELKDSTADEINEERDHFKATCFIIMSNGSTYKKLLDDLKSSSNRGRDEYPRALTDVFDLLVKESGQYDTVRPRNIRSETRGRGGRGEEGDPISYFLNMVEEVAEAGAAITRHTLI